MRYYRFVASCDPKIIGGKGNDQIKGVNKFGPERINEMLNLFSADAFRQLAGVVYEMHYHAKATDIISSSLFSGKLWFVNLQFLRCLDTFKIQPYYLEPAILKHRDKYLEDYFLFQPAPVDLGLPLIDFPNSRFELHHQYPDKIENIEIKSAGHYLDILADIKRDFPKKIIDVKIKSLVFSLENNYDFFYITRIPLMQTCTSPFARKLIDNKIKGIVSFEQRLDPFMTLFPNQNGYVAP